MKDGSKNERVSVKDTPAETVAVSMATVNGWEDVCIKVPLTITLLIDTELNSGTLGEEVIVVNRVDSVIGVGVTTVAESEVAVL